MKKIALLTIALLCLFSLTSSAQIATGSTFLGGSFNVYNEDNETTINGNNQKGKTNGWGFTPQFGKAVGENKILGVFLSLGGSYSDGDFAGYGYNKTESSAVGGGFFYRAYIPLNSRFFLFGESALGVHAYREERKADTKLYNKVGSTAVTLSVTPGISFRATKKLYLETSFSNLLSVVYYRSKTDYYDLNTNAVSQSSKTKRFGVNANTNGFSNISVGVRWIFPSGK